MTLPALALPKDGFIGEYVDFMAGKNDAPQTFHVFSALVLLGACLGNRVWIPYGNKKLYPNLYVCLLAGSSNFRKTTCIRNTKRILRRFEESLIISDRFSMERLFQDLAAKPQGIFMWPEFASAMKYFQKSYMAGMIETLTEFFDCPEDYKRALLKEEVVIKNPVVCIFTGSTPEWLFANMKEEDILGGFYGRFIYVIAQKKEKSLSRAPDIEEKEINHLAEKLSRLKGIQGEVDLAKAGEDFDDFYAVIDRESSKITGGGLHQAFYARICENTLKLATLYHFSKSDDLTLSTEAMSRAINLATHLKEVLADALKKDLAPTPEMKNKLRVLKIIQKDPGIPHGRLLKNSNLMSSQVWAILSQLVEEEQIEAQGKGMKGDPKTYFPV